MHSELHHRSVAVAVTLPGRVWPAVEQPFTLAGPRFRPTPGSGPGRCYGVAARSEVDPGFEGRVLLSLERTCEGRGAEPVGDLLGLVVLHLDGGEVGEGLGPAEELGLARAFVGEDRLERARVRRRSSRPGGSRPATREGSASVGPPARGRCGAGGIAPPDEEGDGGSFEPVHELLGHGDDLLEHLRRSP